MPEHGLKALTHGNHCGKGHPSHNCKLTYNRVRVSFKRRTRKART